jgi:ferritin-like metal-binding protein YciE
MEPITTTAMVSTVVGYLAKTLKEHKSVKDFFNDFTDAAVNWMRPLFLKDENQYEKIMEDLMNKPDSPIKQQQVEAAIASHLEDTPSDAQHLKAMFEQLQEKAKTDKSINISNSKNVVTGSIHAGGNVIVGDNNNTNAPK